MSAAVDVKSPLAGASAERPSLVTGLTKLPGKAKKSEEKKVKDKEENRAKYAGKVKAVDLAKRLRQTIKALTQLDKVRNAIQRAERSTRKRAAASELKVDEKSVMAVLTVADKGGASVAFTHQNVDQMLAKVIHEQKEVLKQMSYIGKRQAKPAGSGALVYLGDGDDLSKVGAQVNPIASYLQSDDFKNPDGTWILANVQLAREPIIPRAMLQSLIQIGYLNSQRKLGWAGMVASDKDGHAPSIAMQQAFGANIPSVFTYAAGQIEPVKAKVTKAKKGADGKTVGHETKFKDVYARQLNNTKANTFQSLKVADAKFDAAKVKPLIATSLIRVNSFPAKPDGIFPSLAAKLKALPQFEAAVREAAKKDDAFVKELNKLLHDDLAASAAGKTRAAKRATTKKPKKAT